MLNELLSNLWAHPIQEARLKKQDYLFVLACFNFLIPKYTFNYQFNLIRFILKLKFHECFYS
jgi:hypothetical protein